MLWYLIKVVVVYIVACVPVPNNPTLVARIRNCSREQSSIVRHFIHSVWRPVFQKHQVQMPAQCPLHFARDLFAVQELAKLHYRANLWTCGICGKSFYREPYLDLHLKNQHTNALAWNDETICYADYCDVFRCKGIIQHRRRKRRSGATGTFSNRQNALYELGINIYDDDIDFDNPDEDSNTDVGENEHKAGKSGSNEFALMTAPPRHVLKALDEKNRHDISGHYVVGLDSVSQADVLQDPFGYNPEVRSTVTPSGSESWLSSRPREKPGKRNRNLSSKEEADLPSRPDYYNKILSKVDRFLKVAANRISRDKSESVKKENPENYSDENDFDKYSESYWENNIECDEEMMAKKQLKCQKLIHDCISPLILKLNDDKYAKMLDSLDRELCWYLTCDRRELFRGESSSTSIPSNASHFILLAILFLILAVFLGMLYYLIWFCF